MKIYDFIVIGSGCSGVMAAQTIAETGASVLVLDAGITSTGQDIPDGAFIDIRKTDTNQYRYMLGDRGEGIDWTDIGKGAQITPPRMHMVRSVNDLIPMRSKTFSPVESLGYGGLGISWGLQCWEYSESDMHKAGLSASDMYAAYDLVSERIGISATKDDASDYTMGKLSHYDPSPTMDRNHSKIYNTYKSKQTKLNDMGVYVSRTPLALITADRSKKRQGYKYRDMDYYSDRDQSAWRPWITMDGLRKLANVTYIGGQLVETYQESDKTVEVRCRDIMTKAVTSYTCRKLVLGTSALGSARIVLRSADAYDHKLPLLCNPYTYIPCIQPSFIGKAAESKKLGMAQLSVFLDQEHDNTDTSVASLYSYQSLMLFRTIRQIPLGFKDAQAVLKYLQTGLVILGVHHPDESTNRKYVCLRKTDTSRDFMESSYELSIEEKTKYAQREKKFTKAASKLGLYPLKRVNPGFGSSIHYAGTLPFSDSLEPFTLSRSGKLHGSKHVYVADSSGFTYLPARGLTFSLMANAHLVAQNAIKDLQS